MKLFQLSSRKFQEQGASVVAVLHCQKYALFPAMILFLFTYKKEYLNIIFQKEVFLFFIGIGVLWIIAQYASTTLVNTASSASFMNSLQKIIVLPFFLFTGIVINGDIPNVWILVSIGLLMIAIFVKPSQHKSNLRALLKFSVPFVIFLILVRATCNTIKAPMYREVLQNSELILFGISVFMIVCMAILTLFLLFQPLQEKEKKMIGNNKYYLYAIPFLWFVASIPEGYAHALMPVYTMIALNAVNFLMDFGSDLKNERIHLDSQTFFFVFLVFVSIIFSVISLS